MNEFRQTIIHCPYCGEAVTILVDRSVDEQQQYVEDCHVCCRPIEISVTLSPGGRWLVEARSEDD